ncbi:transposable element Tcb2 transposase [Trichonephila clavipes]|nr:transposable element Tcb2 transposase [Trichonephila clavipes]
MDDNARPHRANLVDEFLESEDIKRIPWPANPPDLNPIENLWDYLGRAIARRHPPPRIKQRSVFDQVSEYDRGRIVAYRDCGLSFKESVVVLDATKQL